MESDALDRFIKANPRLASWRLVEDIQFKPFNIIDLELVPFLKEGEKSINGQELISRALKLEANLGQRQALHLLEKHGLIPKEFEEFCLPFPRAKWLDGNGNPYIFYLRYEDEDIWRPRFLSLSEDWHLISRLLRLRK